ncbi:hypothetical protein E4T66_14310 [Sinimarinibacterium sp. CAU 1509]|uniref:hypothetical protein n=1 Tax=Sinimarinibacterium sp. CAU 1509 TaxID=2562283 RepID=UPI0010ACDF07|nr:hypothetical protein [Sinimarinibacterium sp. CAU 1509]TJY58775.1 hypothetical protein E4T66_14310 [Sinimarinibacterium sp. CAU 1509]
MKRTALMVWALAAALPGAAQAEPAFARMYKQQYGYPPSCNACHKDGGGTPLNAFGQQFKDAGMTASAFGKISGLDADTDGSANGAEASAKANPGDKHSTPQDKGDWLDTASLIPREVQAAFPGIRAYLPKDAVLTDADIARAKTLGATLGKDDENTIYIPLENQRPAGTALIFPAKFGDKTFFLLLVTDRKLTVTAVSALNTNHVPDAAKRAVYATFAGTALDALPQAKGEDLDAAITRAVKNAGTLVYVRLKGA